MTALTIHSRRISLFRQSRTIFQVCRGDVVVAVGATMAEAIQKRDAIARKAS